MKVMSKENKLYLLGLGVLFFIMLVVTREVTSWNIEGRLNNIEGAINTLNYLIEEKLND